MRGTWERNVPQPSGGGGFKKKRLVNNAKYSGDTREGRLEIL